jgi:hypothetical protein
LCNLDLLTLQGTDQEALAWSERLYIAIEAEALRKLSQPQVLERRHI